ncbi:MAG: hypothetical protein EZS28_020552 [Streblomastix strix]|uniref:NrS-1 polymerase-like helicase domain-containing protein n=1 Tax=Streblomastix strix TaxID=222440 RepID=A0A5J4VMS2_9EUKA|nr:MAG: hypothetical protein EZS28_020552 [Streblomastix strix]
MQPLVDLYMQEQDNKTIIERVKDAMINTVNYTKIGQQDKIDTEGQSSAKGSGLNTNKKQQITGRLIDLSLMKEDNLCVIDFDINKKLPIEEIDKIRQSIIDNMLPANVGLVKTAYGGLHAYCNRNNYLLPANRNIKVITRDNFDIDIFAQMNRYKIDNGKETNELVQNRIVAPNTTIRETKNQVRQNLKYETINDWANASHLASLRQILDQWNVDIEMSQQEYVQQQQDRKYGAQINDDGSIDKMNDELALACVDGLRDLDIHNYPQPLNKEVSLLSQFCGLYGITNETIRVQGINNIRQLNKLTPNADKNYSQTMSQGYRNPNPWILIKILRYHNNDYYEQLTKPLLKKNYEDKKQQQIADTVNQIEKHGIDLKDQFTLLDVSSKAMNGKYNSQLELVAQDLLKVFKVVPCLNGLCFIIKEYDCIAEKNTIKYKSKTAIYDQLRSIKLWQDGKKHITAIDALEQYHSLFEKVGIKFISSNPQIFNVFQGFKYIQLDEVNQTKIDQFLGLVKDTIASNDELIYSYLLNWFSFIVQNVGRKTETSIILQGLQGIGKNIFTTVLCELLAGYSSKNITDIDDFVGKFNTAIENKMLSIANEMKNFGDSRISNMDAMKSINTESTFMINEKCIPKHEVENVVNVIMVTNNVFPLKIETSDRRYVVCKCSSTHRGDLAYFTSLCNSFDVDFYSNLFTFFMTRDISQFNLRDIPMTQAKKDIIRASISPVDDVIIRHIKSFRDGVNCNTVDQWKPQDMRLKNYQLAIKNICERVSKTSDGVRKWVYQLKEEMISIYQNMLDDESDQEEQSIQNDVTEYIWC